MLVVCWLDQHVWILVLVDLFDAAVTLRFWHFFLVSRVTAAIASVTAGMRVKVVD